MICDPFTGCGEPLLRTPAGELVDQDGERDCYGPDGETLVGNHLSWYDTGILERTFPTVQCTTDPDARGRWFGSGGSGSTTLDRDRDEEPGV